MAWRAAGLEAGGPFREPPQPPGEDSGWDHGRDPGDTCKWKEVNISRVRSSLEWHEGEGGIKRDPNSPSSLLPQFSGCNHKHHTTA